MADLINEVQAAFHALSHNYFFIALVGIIVFDYLTGIAKAYIWKVGDSQVGLKGLTKHGFVMLAFFVSYPFAQAFNGAGFVNIVAVLYIMNYAISVLENFAVMGIYVPKFLENKVRSEIERYEKQLENGLSAKQLQEQSKEAKATVKVQINAQDIASATSETQGGE